MTYTSYLCDYLHIHNKISKTQYVKMANTSMYYANEAITGLMRYLYDPRDGYEFFFDSSAMNIAKCIITLASCNKKADILNMSVQIMIDTLKMLDSPGCKYL